MRLNQSYQGALLLALSTLFTGGVLRLYTGSMPSSSEAAPTGTLLASITMTNGWTAPTLGVAFIDLTQEATAIASATGTVGYGRLSATDGTKWVDLSVGLSGTDVIVDAVDVVSGSTVRCIIFRWIQPQS